MDKINIQILIIQTKPSPIYSTRGLLTQITIPISKLSSRRRPSRNYQARRSRGPGISRRLLQELIGPLRLLAHKVWVRLNKGQIIPLGEVDAEPDTETRVDTSGEECSMVLFT